MHQHTMKQFSLACCLLATAAFFGSVLVVLLALTGTPPASLRLAAASIMILTLVLQVAFVLAQLSRAGRTPVNLRVFGPDALVFVLIGVGMPGVLWSRLALIAGTPMNLVMPGFVSPIVVGAILLVGRQIQQHRLRGRGDHVSAS